MFEQLILNKANDLVAEGKYDEAYDYFAFLERNKSYTPGLGKAMDDYLYEEAKDAHRKQQYDSALALLRELYRRNPKRPGLDRALGLTTDKLVEGYVEQEEYDAARVLLRNLAAEYPDHPVAARWRERLTAAGRPAAGRGPPGGRFRPMGQGGRTERPDHRVVARIARCPRTGPDHSSESRAGRGGGRVVRRRDDPRTARRLGRPAHQPAALPDADGVRRRQQRRREVPLSGRRNLVRGPQPAAGGEVEARHPLGHRRRRSQQCGRVATAVGHGRPQRPGLPYRLGRIS